MTELYFEPNPYPHWEACNFYYSTCLLCGADSRYNWSIECPAAEELAELKERLTDEQA